MWRGLGKLILGFFICAVSFAVAEDRNWTGFGAGGEWQNRTNWTLMIPPVPGDSLVFTDILTTHRSATNDYPSGTIFSNLVVANGYKLYGNGVLLQGELRANAGIAAIHVPVAFDHDTTIQCFEHFSISSYDSLSNLDHRIIFSGFGTQIVSTIAAASEVRLAFPGVLRLTNASFYTGQTIVDAGELSMEHNAALGLAAPGSGTIINPSGRLRLRPGLNTYEPLAIAGQVVFPGSPTFVASVNWRGDVNVFGDALLDMPYAELLLHAPVRGTGNFIVNEGTLVLNGTNSFGGVQLNTGGELRLLGYQPEVPVLLNGGLLTGSGTAGEILVTGTNISTVRLGTFPYSVRVGTMTASNLLLNSNVRYEVELTAGGSDKLVVHGAVDLNNAVLALALSDLPPGGTEYTIIDNDGTDAVSGQFAGLPQGTLIEMGNGARLTIDYAGGDGNDVVLTVDHFAIKWAGGFTSGNNLWTTRQNWFYGLLPSSGDELQFGYTQYSKTNVNDIPNYPLVRALVFGGPNSSGWRLQGNPIVLLHGVFDANPSGTNVIALEIRAGNSITISNSTGTLIMAGNITTLYGGGIEFHTDGALIVSGSISSSGRVQKTGNGTLVFQPVGGFPGSRIVETRFANGGFELTGWGLPGVTYAIQASDNLKDWNKIGETVCADSGEYVCADSSGRPWRFYRVRSPD